MNSEYAQAFTMSWITIEKYIFSLWQQYLNQRKISGNRKKKLLDSGRWSVDYILETLSLDGFLKGDEYKLLNILRRMRNKFVHEGKPISRDAAQQCVNFGFDVVKTILADFS